MEQSDIVNIIINTINTIFSNIFSSIDNSIYANLDNCSFIGSDIIDNSIFKNLLGSNGKNGLIYLADAMLLGFSIFYCVRLYYSNYVESNIEKPSQFIFKIIIFSIVVNFSYFILQQILDINYLFSSSIQEIGKGICNCDISFAELIIKLNSKITINESSLDLFSLDGLLKSFISVGLLNLLFTYSIRSIIVQLLVLFSPFAFLSLLNNSLSWIFRSWIKCLFSILIIQSFIALILIIIFSLDFDNKILFIAGIYCLTKINSTVRELFGGIGVDFSGNMSSLMQFMRK